MPLTTTRSRPDTTPAAKQRRAAGGRHLKRVQYLPVGDDSVVCAAIWREGDHVHLASPLLPTRCGMRDPQAYVRQPVHILTPSATLRRIVNMTALTSAEINATR